MELHRLAQRLFTQSPPAPHIALRTLARFGEAALTATYQHGIRVTLLQARDTYAQYSPTLRQIASDLDRWPHPPAGLFVVAERTMYIRQITAMTIAHEFGHALDCTLGNGVYYSNQDIHLQSFFAQQQPWITPYAATSVEEYFAEALRAYVNANDAHSPWPPATRQRLQRVNYQLFRYIEELFSQKILM